MQMERDGEPFGYEFDYSWVDSAITNAVSYYQSAEQLKEIFWGVPGSWYLEGPKGPKRVCSQFRGCGFLTYDILNRELDDSAPFSEFELGVLCHLRVD